MKVCSAPGRADFLNTHQDYKGLPVVPVAIDLRTRCWGRRLAGRFRIKSLNLEELGEPCVDEFEVRVNQMEPGWFGNYFRGIVNVLLKHGYKIDGMEVTVRSEVPVGSGLSSSAALEVSFLKLLDATYGLGLSKRELAELAFEAENREVGVPCGRLDQYGCTFGGMIKLECRPPYRVEELPAQGLIFAIIDSGIRHSTADIHPIRQRELNEGLKALSETPLGRKLGGLTFDQARWELLTEAELRPYLDSLPEKPAKRLLFTVLQQLSTELALKVLREQAREGEVKELLGCSGSKLEVLGRIMNLQHEYLRDLYEVSLPELEQLREACLRAGALGVKISGAGMGGSLIALVPDRRTGERVVREAVESGARAGWVSEVAEGVREERRERSVNR